MSDDSSGALRVAVVGASSGLGRCIAVGLAQRGAQSRACSPAPRTPGRRGCQEAGNGAVAIACDVTDAASCRPRHGRSGRRAGRPRRPRLHHRHGRPRTRSPTSAPSNGRNCSPPTSPAPRSSPPPRRPHLAAAGGSAVYLSSLSASYTDAVADARLLRGQQGGAGQARRSLADRASRTSASPDWRWATASAGRVTRRQSSTRLGSRCAGHRHQVLDGAQATCRAG